MTYIDNADIDLEVEDDDNDQGKPGNVDIDDYRKTQKENRRLKAQADAGNAAQRELAFVKATVDTSTPQGKFFFDNYKGELTVEAVKAAATEMGLVKGAAETADKINEAAKTASDAAAAAAVLAHGGMPHDGNTGIDVMEQARDNYTELRRNGVPMMKALERSMADLFFNTPELNDYINGKM